MKKTLVLTFIFISLTFAYAYAEEPTPEPPFSLEGTIELPNGCEVEDTDGTTHIFPEVESPSEFLAICAIVAAHEAGIIDDFEVTDHPSFGLFLKSVNGIEGDAAFWALWLNGEFAQCGIDCLVLQEGDILSLVFTTFEGAESDRVDLTISTLVETPDEEPTPPPAPPPPSGGNNGNNDPEFDVPAALAYLASKHEPDDSFVTDWVAIAYGAVDGGAAESELRSYLLNATPSLSSVTDYERHAMALMALDINPYSDTGTDYIAPIVDAFDGTQIGSGEEVNDDIFALFPLLKAGYGEDDEIVQDIVAFIVVEQKADGSWKSNLDMTAAGIQALAEVEGLPGVNEVLSKARSYLEARQNSDGGFGDPFATSWVMQAISALNESPEDWDPEGDSPEDYLAGEQSEDGGVLNAEESDQNRVWATAYAIPAALGEPWSEILSSFSKPSTNSNETSSGGSSSRNSSASSTNSAPAISTTTPTPLVLGVTASTNATPPTIEEKASRTSNAPYSVVVVQESAYQTESTAPTSTNAQLAAAAESSSEFDGSWLWLSGLFLMFGVTFYFFHKNPRSLR